MPVNIEFDNYSATRPEGSKIPAERPFKDFDLRFLYINNQLAVSLKAAALGCSGVYPSCRWSSKSVNPIARRFLVFRRNFPLQ